MTVRRRPARDVTQSSTDDLGRALVADRVEVLFAVLPKARDGKDPDAIHDLRVASRRLREALSVFPSGAGREERAADWVRKLTRAAGRLRNSDVWIAYLSSRRARSTREKETVESIRAWERDRRPKRVRKFRRKLEKLRPERMRRVFRDLLADPEAPRGRAPGAAAGETLRPIVIERAEQALALAPDAAASGDSGELHETRIAFKRLRYALELATTLFGRSPYRLLVATLKGFQDVLGEIHDRDVFLDAAAKAYERTVESTPRKRSNEIPGIEAGFAALGRRLASERRALLARFRKLVAGDGAEVLARSAALGARPALASRGLAPAARARHAGRVAAHANGGAAPVAER